MLIPLRPLSELTQPDSWWGAIAVRTESGFSSITLEDHYASIKDVTLHSGVPEDVAQLFETARNLYVYAFFAHRFLSVVELQSSIAVEAALREHFVENALLKGVKSPMLSKLLKRAIEEKSITDEGFRIWRDTERMRMEDAELMSKIDAQFAYVEPEDDQAYCKILQNAIPGLRNSYAHGSFSFHPGALTPMVIAADLINQLFPEPASPQAHA